MKSLRSALALAAVLLLAACSEDTIGPPREDSTATYELRAIDGLAYGRVPFESFEGTRILDHGEWTEQYTRTVEGETLTLDDYGTYTTQKGAVVFFSKRTYNEHIGVLKGDEMVIAPGVGLVTYHWKRIR